MKTENILQELVKYTVAAVFTAVLVIALFSESLIGAYLTSQRPLILDTLHEMYFNYEFDFDEVTFSYKEGLTVKNLKVALRSKLGYETRNDFLYVDDVRVRLSVSTLLRTLDPIKALHALTLEGVLLKIVPDDRFVPEGEPINLDEIAELLAPLKGKELSIKHIRAYYYDSFANYKEAAFSHLITDISVDASLGTNRYALSLGFTLPRGLYLSLAATTAPNLRDYTLEGVLSRGNALVERYALAIENGHDAFGVRVTHINGQEVGVFTYDYGSRRYALSVSYDSIDSFLFQEVLSNAGTLAEMIFEEPAVKALLAEAGSDLPFNVKDEFRTRLSTLREGRFSFSVAGVLNYPPSVVADVYFRFPRDSLTCAFRYDKERLTLDTLVYQQGAMRIAANGVVDVANMAVDDIFVEAENVVIDGEPVFLTASLDRVYTAERNARGYELGVKRFKFGVVNEKDWRFGILHFYQSDVLLFETLLDPFALTTDVIDVNGMFNFAPGVRNRAVMSVKRVPSKKLHSLVGLNDGEMLPRYSSFDLLYEAFEESDGRFTHRVLGVLREPFTYEPVNRIDLAIDGNTVTINELAFLDVDNLSLSGVVTIHKGMRFDARLSLTTPLGVYTLTGYFGPTGLSDTRYAFGVRTAENTVQAEGFIDDGRYRVDVIANEFPLTKAFLLKEASLSLTSREGGGANRVYGSLHVAETKTVDPINVRAQFQYLTSLSLDSLVYERGGNVLGGTGTVEFRDLTYVAKAMLTNTDRGETNVLLGFAMNQVRGNTFGTLRVNALPLRYFVDVKGLSGDIFGDVSLVGTLDNPYVTIKHASLRDLEYYTDRFVAQIRGHYRDRALRITEGFVQKTGQSGVKSKERQMITTTNFYVSEDETFINISVENFTYLSEINADVMLRSEKEFNTDMLVVTMSNVTLDEDPVNAFALAARIEDDAILIHTVSNHSHGVMGEIRQTASNTRSLALHYYYDNKQYLNVEGSLAETRDAQKGTSRTYTDLTVTSRVLDARVAKYANQMLEEITCDPKTFRFDVTDPHGYTTYLKVKGPLDDIRASGRFVSKGKLKLKDIEKEAGDYDLSLRFHDKRIFIDRFHLDFEDKRFLDVSGHITHKSNAINNLALNLFSSQGKDGLNATINLGFVKVQGPMGLAISITSNFYAPAISGDIVFTECDVAFPMQERQEFYRQRYFDFFQNAKWNLAIRTREKVNVSYAFNFFSLDCMLKPGKTLRVSNRMSDNTLELSGVLEAEPLKGHINFLGNTYQIEKLQALFDPRIERGMDPIITGSFKRKAKTYGVMDNSRPMDITLQMSVEQKQFFAEVLTMSPYSSEIPLVLDSTPPVSKRELHLLVGIPSLKDEGVSNALPEDTTLRVFIGVPSDIIFQDRIIRPVEKWAQKNLGLDFFSLQTGVFSRVTEDLVQGQLTNRTLDYLKDTRLTVGKYIKIGNLPEFFLRYDLTFLGGSLDEGMDVSDLFSQKLGIEIDLFPLSDLANFTLEYKIDPLQLTNYEINISTKWRF